MCMEGKERVATSEDTLAACGTGRRRDGPRTRRPTDANRSSQAAARGCMVTSTMSSVGASSTRGPLMLRELSEECGWGRGREKGGSRSGRGMGERGTYLIKEARGVLGRHVRLGPLGCSGAVAVRRHRAKLRQRRGCASEPQSPARWRSVGSARLLSHAFTLRFVHCMLDGFCCLLPVERYVCFMSVLSVARRSYVGRQGCGNATECSSASGGGVLVGRGQQGGTLFQASRRLA